MLDSVKGQVVADKHIGLGLKYKTELSWNYHNINSATKPSGKSIVVVDVVINYLLTLLKKWINRYICALH